MYILLSVLIIIAAVIMVLVVLVQNSKGGGLAANFQSSNQMMGVRRTTDFLEKSTWTLATILIVLSIVASLTISNRQETEEGSMIQDQIENAVDPSAMPIVPPVNPGDATPAPSEEQ